MTRMNKRQRDHFYPLVETREIRLGLPLMNVGPYCRGCGITLDKDGDTAPQGVIDCIKNDGNHRILPNLQLLCRACNTVKNPRRPDPNPNMDNISWEASRSLVAERNFRGWTMAMITKHGAYPIDDLISAGAEKAGISTITAGRYLKKMTSSRGPFAILGGQVQFKSPEAVDEWLGKDAALAAPPPIEARPVDDD